MSYILQTGIRQNQDCFASRDFFCFSIGGATDARVSASDFAACPKAQKRQKTLAHVPGGAAGGGSRIERPGASGQPDERGRLPRWHQKGANLIGGGRSFTGGKKCSAQAPNRMGGLPPV